MNGVVIALAVGAFAGWLVAFIAMAIHVGRFGYDGILRFKSANELARDQLTAWQRWLAPDNLIVRRFVYSGAALFLLCVAGMFIAATLWTAP